MPVMALVLVFLPEALFPDSPPFIIYSPEPAAGSSRDRSVYPPDDGD